MFWQWANQSINVGFNWANSNKSNVLTTEQTVEAYIKAVAVSCTIALSLTKLSSRMNSQLLKKLIPFTSVATASAFNVYLMRKNEIETGIDIYAKEKDQKQLIGKSSIAAKRAILEVAFSRMLTSMPTLTLIPFIYSYIASKTSNSKILLPMNIALVGIGLQVGLPCATALFPQESVTRVWNLEPEFHSILRDGKPVETVYYNKGM